MATLKRDQYQLWAASQQPVGGFAIGDANGRRFAQGFTPSVSGTLDKLYINVQKSGSPGNLIVEIFAADGSGKPTGLALATETIDQSAVSSDTSGPPRLEVTFSSPATLSSGTEYVYTLRAPLGEVFSNFYHMYGRTGASAYSGGKLHYTVDGGANWNDANGDASFVTEMSTVVTQPALDQFATGLVVGAGADRIEINTTFRAQTFTPSVSGELKQVQIAMDRLDGQTGGTVTLEIQNTSSGLPGGTVLATHTINDADILSGSGSPVLTRTFASPATLVSGTVYALVIKCNNASGSARYRLYHTFTHNQYSGGQACISTNSGSTWAADTSPVEIMFGTFMQEPDNTITGLRIDQYQLNFDSTDITTNVRIGNGTADRVYAQTFTPSVTGNLKKIHLPLRRVGSTSSGNLVIAIQGVSGGEPNGTDLATFSIPPTTFPNTNEWFIQEIAFSTPPALTASTQYAIVARALTNGDYRWSSSQSATRYSGGQAMYSLNSGSTWTQQSTKDLCFVTEMDVTIAQPGIDQFGFGTIFGGSADRVESATEYRAQTFDCKIGEKLKSVILGLRRRNSQTGGNVIIEIRETISGQPTGTLLASKTVPDTSIPTASNTTTTFEFTTSPDLTENTKYAIVLQFPNASGSSGYDVMHIDEGLGSSSGSAWRSTNSGSTWTELSGANDLMFATVMFAPTVTSQTILSNATVFVTNEQTINSNAFHGETNTQIINSDAIIFITSEHTILSDAFHGQETAQTILSDAAVGVTVEEDIFSNAFVGQETAQTILSDASILAEIQQVIFSDATVLLTVFQTILSDANIAATVVQTINANASISITNSQTISSNAVIIVREPVLKLFVVT